MVNAGSLTHVESTPLVATMESSRTHGPQQGAALMKRTTKYVALDVHQATTLASVHEESGRVIARSILPTDGPALTEFFRGMRGAIHVAIEEGTQAQWLHDLLAPHVDRLIVCDRRGQPRQGNKDDRHDADALSEQLRRGGLRAAYHGGGTGTGLKELTRCYENLVEDATRVMLRLKALFRARAIQTPGRAVYRPARRAEWLAQLPPRGGPGPGRGALGGARRASRPAPACQSRAARRGRARARVGRAADDSLLRARARGAAARHDADAVAVSDQAAAVGVCGPGRGDPLERRLRARRRAGSPPPAGAPDPRAESESQPPLEARVQECGHRRSRAARPAPRLAPRPRRPRAAGAVGRRDARAQARGAHPAALEERRALRSHAADAASALDRIREAAVRVTALADAPGSGTTERGEVSSDPFTRPAVGRGTALTLGPLAEPEEVSGRLRAESPIEPWFARRATPALASHPAVDRERKARSPMRKKTAPQTGRHHQTPSPHPSALIARAKTATQSAVTTSPLDNRSHRTDRA